MNHAQAIAFVASYVEHRNATFDLAIEVLTEAALRAKTDARALWAVRVLDAWAYQAHLLNPPAWHYAIPELRPAREALCCFSWDERSFPGSNPDAARLAAAEAVFPELPEAVRTKLGERP